MRVLQLGPLYNNHLRRWSSNAAAAGAEVVAAGHVRAGRAQTDLGNLVGEVEVLPAALVDGDPEAALEWLGGVLNRMRPDVVQAHWLPRWGYLATRSGHDAVIVTPWGSDVYELTGAQRARADSALHDGHAVIARSPHMEAELRARGASPGRVHRVDLGVDLARFRPAAAAERARLRRELGLPERGPLVLSLRAGTDLYNLDVVLAAHRIVRRLRRDANLVLVPGDAPLAEPTRQALRGAKGVHVVARVAHTAMPAYVRTADAGVSIPRSDGSPSSVWEALACGVPTVLSDLPQVRERARGSGAAVFVEPRPQSVAEALLDVLDARDNVAPRARDWAVANLDERGQIERLGRLYASVRTRRCERGPEPAATSAPRPGRKRRAVALPPRPS